MRKVKFKVRDLSPGAKQRWTDFINVGTFHCWGVSYEEFESGPGNFTVAIVEDGQGNVIEVLPSNIQFVTPLIS